MIPYFCEQGSREWWGLRLGRPTASAFDKIVTPENCKLSTQSKKYRYMLLAERITGLTLDPVSTKAMQAGREKEPRARKWYEWHRGVTVKPVGIGFTDDGRIGASPDGIVIDCSGDEGLVEIKCPLSPGHIGYLLTGVGITKEYKAQIQGQMWVWNKAKLDSVSFCPPFPESLVCAERDTEYIQKLDKAVTEFADQLDADLQRLLDLGCKLSEPSPIPVAEDYLSALGVNDADVEQILASKGMA